MRGKGELEVEIDGGRSRLAAGVFGILFGAFGVHRFYLKDPGIGIAQIALTLVTGIGGFIWGFIDGMRILVGEINADAEGKPLRDPVYAEAEREQKSRLAAGIFGVLLGWAGVHRFYLGHTGIGIAQIIVTVITAGLGALWGFIEGILILTNSPSFRTDATGRPLRNY
ncbi:MAG: TM2 domain-containing protein [Candidatus Aquicultorales bacterium]